MPRHHGGLLRLWLVETLATYEPNETRALKNKSIWSTTRNEEAHPIDKIECPDPRGANDRRRKRVIPGKFALRHGTC